MPELLSLSLSSGWIQRGSGLTYMPLPHLSSAPYSVLKGKENDVHISDSVVAYVAVALSSCRAVRHVKLQLRDKALSKWVANAAKGRRPFRTWYAWEGKHLWDLLLLLLSLLYVNQPRIGSTCQMRQCGKCLMLKNSCPRLLSKANSKKTDHWVPPIP